MTDYGGLKVHPAADAIPLLDDAQRRELAVSIKTKGQKHPIMLTDDGKQIIDGRNRYLACMVAGVKPKFTKFRKGATEIDIVDFVQIENLNRRDLNPGQRAIAFLALEKLRGNAMAAEAKERQREGQKKGGKAGGRGRRNSLEVKSPQTNRAPQVRGQMAKQAKVGDATMKQALAIQDHPDLVEDVRAGKKTVNDAAKEKRARDKANAEPKEKVAPSKHHVILVTHEGKQVPYPLPKGKPQFNRTNDHVSWAKWTWNPVTGCLHECWRYCYAREMANRPSYKDSYPVGFTPLFHHERLDAPANMEVPEEAKTDPGLGRVFVCSMADLYGKWVPEEWIEKVHASCVANPRWEYLLLTKFPRRYVGLKLPPTAWAGTTVDTQKRVRLAEEAFRQISGVRVKWLSLEPLLEPVEFSDLSMFDWVVIGSQTATVQPEGRMPEFAPPFEWVARLTAQAKAAGCKVWQKPNLLGHTDAQSPGMKLIQEIPDLPPLPAAQGDLGFGQAAE